MLTINASLTYHLTSGHFQSAKRDETSSCERNAPGQSAVGGFSPLEVKVGSFVLLKGCFKLKMKLRETFGDALASSSSSSFVVYLVVVVVVSLIIKTVQKFFVCFIHTYVRTR